MHTHDSELTGVPSLRPRGDRITEESLDASAGRSAAAQHTESLTPDAILGLQRSAGNAGVAQLLEDGADHDHDHVQRSSVHDVVGSGGRPLDTDVRTDMEGRFGHDFGDVRIHDDPTAAASAKDVNAHAYTVGSDIVFGGAGYDPQSSSGRTTLAHELTHVVQQRQGPVDGTAAPGGIAVSDPGDRFEREASANADRIVADPAPVAPVAPVQREAEDEQEEEAPVQGLWVQREEAPEEEPDEPAS